MAFISNVSVTIFRSPLISKSEMPSFGNWVKQTAGKAQRFFGKTAGHVRTGVSFLNNTVLPGAHKAHRALTNASQELSRDPNLGDKNRERLKTLSKLADVGLQRLSSTTDTINRVHAAV